MQLTTDLGTFLHCCTLKRCMTLLLRMTILMAHDKLLNYKPLKESEMNEYMALKYSSSLSSIYKLKIYCVKIIISLTSIVINIA